MTFTRKISKKLVCFILAAVLLCGTHVLDAAKAEMLDFGYYSFKYLFHYSSNPTANNVMSQNVTVASNGTSKAYVRRDSYTYSGSSAATLTVSSNSSTYQFNAVYVTGSSTNPQSTSYYTVPPYGTSYSVAGNLSVGYGTTNAAIGCSVKG